MAMPEFPSLALWEARREGSARRSWPRRASSRCPSARRSDPQVFGRLEREGYTVEKVLLETLPGFYLGGNLYRPRGTAARHPGVLKAHGHWNYGRLEHQPLAEQQTLCANLAQQGYVVFNYDMVGYNDTVQTPHSFGGPREDLWSFGPLGLQLWNSIRALDFLQSLEDVDPDRIGMTGASGGGTQTFLLYAVDERVRCAAPVNMISGIMQGGDPCENAPGLRVGTSNVEIGAMMAPRPAAHGVGHRRLDEEHAGGGVPGHPACLALFGRPEAVENAHFDAPHNFHRGSREAVYRFFARHLLGEAHDEEVREKELDPEPLQNVLALHGRGLPEGALTFEELFDVLARDVRPAGDGDERPGGFCDSTCRDRSGSPGRNGSRWRGRARPSSWAARGQGDRVPGASSGARVVRCWSCTPRARGPPAPRRRHAARSRRNGPYWSSTLFRPATLQRRVTGRTATSRPSTSPTTPAACRTC